MREFRDFKMSVRKPAEDPLQLKNRVHLLSNGCMEIKEEERENQNSESVAEKLFEQDRLQTYSILLFRIQATYMIMRRTTEQWNLFQRDRGLWFGNITMKYGRPVDSYRAYPILGLKIMIRSVQSVTWNRTQQLHKVHAIACCLDSDMLERT